MNATIEAFHDAVQNVYPAAVLEVHEPLHTDSIWWLDIRFKGKTIAVQWCPQTESYGLTDITSDDTEAPGCSYGEGPAHRTTNFVEAMNWIATTVN